MKINGREGRRVVGEGPPANEAPVVFSEEETLLMLLLGRKTQQKQELTVL